MIGQGLVQLHADTWPALADAPPDGDPEAAARYMRARLLRDTALPTYAACHCLCGRAHPAKRGICLAEDARVTRTLHTELLGAVVIPLCEPCADAWAP